MDSFEPGQAPHVMIAPQSADLDVAVLIPCYNEAVAIGGVVHDFRAALPSARIFVYDNNSRDETVRVAEAAGAIVRREPWQGKGNVVRRMFSDIEADLYLLVDGDGTYDAPSAPKLIAALLDQQLDMVVGARVEQAIGAYRPGHRFGNALLTGLVSKVFGRTIRDMLSGYRVFTRRFVKSFPAMSAGFEIETELSVHALELRMKIAEIDTPYGERPEGSFRQAVHLSRRLAHPEAGLASGEGRAAGGFLLRRASWRCWCCRSPSVCRWWWSSPRPVWCRASRPRSCRPASCYWRS